MAIIQISQIKHRRGLRDDLPNPSLEEGELGLALDTGEMFIGTPNLPVAAFRAATNTFPYANTQILTEWTDNVRSLLQYAYRNRKIDFSPTDAVFVPGSDFGNPILRYNTNQGSREIFVVRKLQERLDEIVSVKSYGARGDATRINSGTDNNNLLNAETQALRRAALDAVNVTNKTNEMSEYQPKALHFPAGVYAVNDSIFLPPNSTWIGDGKENTIITLVSSVNPLDYRHRCLFFTVDGLLQPEDADNNVEIYQHSYSNIVQTIPTSTMCVLPENIFVTGITFEINYNQDFNTNIPFDIGRLIRAKNVTFFDCKFKGNWSLMNEVKSDFNNTPALTRYFPGQPAVPPFIGVNGDSVGVIIDSYNAVGAMNQEYKPFNITFLNCDFEDVTYASMLTDDVTNITFMNGTFNRHYKGIVVSEPENQNIPNSQITYGSAAPKNINIMNNYFSNIKFEAIDVFSTDNIYQSALTKIDNEYFGGGVNSISNRFDNVGNNNTNNGSLNYHNLAFNPASPVINFRPDSKLNSSIGDTFGRSFVDEFVSELGVQLLPIGGHNFKRIEYTRSDSNIVLNSQDFIQKQYRTKLITVGTTFPFVFDQNLANTIEFNYVLVPNYITPSVSAKRRIGKMTIITNSENNGLAEFEDEYNEVGDPIDLQLTTLVSGNECKIRSLNNEGLNVVIYYNYEYNNSF